MLVFPFIIQLIIYKVLQGVLFVQISVLVCQLIKHSSCHLSCKGVERNEIAAKKNTILHISLRYIYKI